MIYPTIDNFDNKAARLKYLVCMATRFQLNPPMEDPFGLHGFESNDHLAELIEALQTHLRRRTTND